jgi:vitamin-K-epoxide reductase (warfarin-sensitive)
MLISILVLAAVGFCISLYTYLLEKKIKKQPNYKSVCDISDRVSCTKPMKSPYASIFYFSNAIVGVAYYLMIIVLALLQMHSLLLFATVIGCIASAFLAYLLYFKIKSLCLLCTSLYIINILLLLLAIRYR